MHFLKKADCGKECIKQELKEGIKIGFVGKLGLVPQTSPIMSQESHFGNVNQL